MAEAIFRDLIKKEALEQYITVDSAGTGSWHIGNPPHKGTRDILTQHHISYEGIQARQVNSGDFGHDNYIIAMDDQNISSLEAMQKEKQNITIAKLLDFVDDVKDKNVPDPYFTGDFHHTYALVLAGCKNLLGHIKKKHQI